MDIGLPHASVRDTLLPAYQPCNGFSGVCHAMRWNPPKGHVPRGFIGCTGEPEEVEIVMVVAEPGEPYPPEAYRLTSDRQMFAEVSRYVSGCFVQGTSLFHRNFRNFLDLCWPATPLQDQLRKVWFTESVLCSAHTEGGSVSPAVERECAQRYLLPQLAKFPNALVVAFGGKAYRRLRKVVPDPVKAFALAPPGCNRRGARPSWERVALQVRQRSA